jgi:hypothetical protein
MSLAMIRVRHTASAALYVCNTLPSNRPTLIDMCFCTYKGDITLSEWSASDLVVKVVLACANDRVFSQQDDWRRRDEDGGWF